MMPFPKAGVPLLGAALALWAGPAAAAPEIGQPAPTFSLPDQGGKVHRLSDYRGKTVILAFYPKDFTGGCTCEVQALRDSLGALQAHNAVVFAISADTVESHKRFADTYHLPYALLADPEKTAIKAYGALGHNGLANRYTFVIAPDGTIRHIDRAVNSEFAQENGKLTSRHATDLALLLSSWQAKLGEPVPNFSLQATDGSTVTPFQPGKKAAVVVFMSNNCPVSRDYEARLKAAAAEHPDVSFLAINSNADQTMADARALADRAQLGFPVVKDEGSRIADHFGAQATPTVWVMDAKGTAIYRGAVDDSQDAARVTKRYLADALEAATGGKPVQVAQTQAFGCAIRRR